MKWLAIVSAGIMALIPITEALAGSGPYTSGWAFYGYGVPYQQKINLTPEQKEKLQALQKSYEEKTAPPQKELEIKKAELRVLLLQDQPDSEKIKGKLEEINNLQTQIQKIVVDVLLEAQLPLKVLSERGLDKFPNKREALRPMKWGRRVMIMR